MSGSSAFGLGNLLVSGLGLISNNAGSRDSYAEASGQYGAYKGLQQQSITDELAANEQQAQFTIQDTEALAKQKASEVNQARSEQESGYLASGVTLEGTPLAILEHTRRLGEEEINAIKARGVATADLIRNRARIGASEAQAKMIGQDYSYGVDQMRSKMAASRTYGDALSSALTGAGNAFPRLNPYTAVSQASASQQKPQSFLQRLFGI